MFHTIISQSLHNHLKAAKRGGWTPHNHLSITSQSPSSHQKRRLNPTQSSLNHFTITSQPPKEGLKPRTIISQSLHNHSTATKRGAQRCVTQRHVTSVISLGSASKFIHELPGLHCQMYSGFRGSRADIGLHTGHVIKETAYNFFLRQCSCTSCKTY